MVTSVRQRAVAIGVFSDRSQAQHALSDLRLAGFAEDQIGVIAHFAETERSELPSEGQQVLEGAMTGIATGAGLGALWALAISVGLLPAIGPVVAGGLFASVLASAASAAVVGGLFGALVELGIPQPEAQYYDQEFRAGRTIITVRSSTRFDEATRILRAHHGYDMHTGREFEHDEDSETVTPPAVVSLDASSADSRSEAFEPSPESQRPSLENGSSAAATPRAENSSTSSAAATETPRPKLPR